MAWWKRKRRSAQGVVLEGPVDGLRRGQIGASFIEVGRFTYGLKQAEIKEWGEGAALRLGAFCSIAQGLRVLLGGNHRVDWATTFPFGHIFADTLGGVEIDGHPQSGGDVVIGNDVWIGANVTILSGVTIGDGAVIGATATVAKSVGPYEIWGGNPARLLRHRFPPEMALRLQALHWWNWPVETIQMIAPLLSRPPNAAVLDQLEALHPDRPGPRKP